MFVCCFAVHFWVEWGAFTSSVYSKLIPNVCHEVCGFLIVYAGECLRVFTKDSNHICDDS